MAPRPPAAPIPPRAPRPPALQPPRAPAPPKPPQAARAPTAPLSHAEHQDALGRAVSDRLNPAGGDRSREPELLDAFQRTIDVAVKSLMRRLSELRPYYDDFQNEGRMSVTVYGRKYDGRGPLKTLIERCVQLDLRTMARTLMAKGARVRRGPIDWSSACFAPHGSLAAAVAEGVEETGEDFRNRVREANRYRQIMKQRLRRLTLLEREVFVRANGILEYRPTIHPYYMAVAMKAAVPEPHTRIATSMRLTESDFAALLECAATKIAHPTKAEIARKAAYFRTLADDCADFSEADLAPRRLY